MSPTEIRKLQAYLQAKFNNQAIEFEKRPKADNGSVEFYIAGEFIGVAYRDDEDGEVSYSLNICILEEDLPIS